MDDEYRIYKSFPDKSEITAFVLGALPFVCNFTTTSSSTVNGQVTAFQQTDYVAIGAGILAIIVTLNTFNLWRDTAPDDLMKRRGAFVILLLLGAYQVARGLGVFTNI